MSEAKGRRFDFVGGDENETRVVDRNAAAKWMRDIGR
jgi:hypothetical protein